MSDAPRPQSRLTKHLANASPAAFSTYAIFAAFSTYFCMYAFRKPFAVATFEGSVDMPGLPPMDYKVLLIIAQVIGYCLSKFVGIKVISEMSGARRGLAIVVAIAIAEGSLALFALTPAPYNAIWLFTNGLPLGMVWGLVFGYLEGRRVSEVLGAGLSASYIVASMFVKTVGGWVLAAGISEFWMPFVTGLIFLLPMLIAVWLLSQLPPPSAEDERLRTRREPMDAATRKRFVMQFLPGLAALTSLYILLTAYRDFRDNFSAEIWASLGYGDTPEIMTYVEIPVAVGVLIGLALIMRVRDNRRALTFVHLLMMGGSILLGLSTLAFQAGLIGPVAWSIAVGLGLYLGYVPFGCVLFDRLIATVGFVGTAGFMIYVTDAFGYLGSVGLLLYKNFGQGEVSWLEFFINLSYITSIVCTGAFLLSMLYFMRAARRPADSEA